MIPKKRDKIKIGKESFDVLNVFLEFDEIDFNKIKEDSISEKYSVLREKGLLIGEHYLFELHKFGDKALFATHSLKIYQKDLSKGYLYKFKDNEFIPLKDLPKGKRKEEISYIKPTKKKIIQIKDIKIL